jgi:hypothetical protein
MAMKVFCKFCRQVLKLECLDPDREIQLPQRPKPFVHYLTMTPAMVHHGQAAHILAHRQVVLDAAFRVHPERFVRKPPRPPSQVWINRPPSEENTP